MLSIVRDRIDPSLCGKVRDVQTCPARDWHPHRAINHTQAQGLLEKAKRADAADGVSRALASADLPRLQQAVKVADRAGLVGEMVDKCRQAVAICVDLRNVIDSQVGRDVVRLPGVGQQQG